MDDIERMQVWVAYATPYVQVELPLMVEPDCTVIRAVRRSGILTRFPEIEITRQPIGIFGKKALLDNLLQPQDRIEIYRPLIVDPKQSRKSRAVNQRSPS